jgi:MurNAc alpha-1-phosphate uridylyltransferase
MTGTRAMMLAAGLGTRMRPLTLTRPKPLIEVAGRSLLDRGVDALQRAGISEVVVNKHYLAGQIDSWAAARTTPHIIVQDEEALILDTGGGVAKALPHLGPDPFFVLNSDSFWVDGPQPALQRMRQAWNDATMDCLAFACPQGPLYRV